LELALILANELKYQYRPSVSSSISPGYQLIL